MRVLYPAITPFHTFLLETGGIHQVYVEQSGNPAGMPVIFLHGGPCSGTRPDHRRFFNPERYHIILFDQRGCGQSLPFGELQDNTTQDLLEDMERIRTRLGLRQWLLFGGSWGGTLALLYAQQHPHSVLGMILRGVFLARQADMDWFLGNGVNRIYPRQWQDLKDSLPPQFADSVQQGLYRTVFADDEDLARRAAKQWLRWGGLVALGNEFIEDAEPVGDQALKQVRMELHYARHGYFIKENQILDNCWLLQHIPAIIVHGQHDLTCPLESGWLLHQALPAADFQILSHAGHIARGEQMIDALVSASDKMARIL
ncbi:MAG: prolyl aminopeptidase [Methylococcales bacterium]|nr:prolyl aminopeptidase [Methylococcales bacterium]